MNQFQYVQPAKSKAAIDTVTKDQTAMFIAGGTNLLDLMKRGIVTPEKLVDINKLPLKKIQKENGAVRIGALALNGETAEDKLVLEKHPLLSQALNAGASAQLRNMATVGGNMLQRTRCPYFYDTALPCNKREPGTGCGALEGYNRMHAIFGHSEKCIAVHPSDMSVALAALDATVLVSGPKGDRKIPFADFHRLPGDTPHIETNLQKGELILAVDLPENPYTKNIHYLKIRDRASYAFALISVAAALDLDGSNIRSARLAMGGVAHKPWRLTEAENFLAGKPATETTFRQAADLAMRGAKAFEHNKFKLKLGPNAIVQALKNAAGVA
ncbi:FAD binding domain-containing protein [Pontibacter arcticus]|uniref:Xanthine dehydrogenase family protein subunit M n=1 Tax=Pontibacter arcticus TaxID=2080288 RepID=A0A364RC75_9BACT|nr:xanthine dehydrogenase family protein subunit M [Pontibacter arcticus]RAU81855.1 xanthine dehydrogenase family protein subunit M [Pontibacter arcticus]